MADEDPDGKAVATELAGQGATILVQSADGHELRFPRCGTRRPPSVACGVTATGRNRLGTVAAGTMPTAGAW